MQARNSTPPSPAISPGRRRVMVLVGGPFPGPRHEEARRAAGAVDGSDVLVVAPKRAIPGERWIIDLDTREAHARANVESWIAGLADAAASIRGELGDENPRLAAADARDGFAADEVLTAGSS